MASNRTDISPAITGYRKNNTKPSQRSSMAPGDSEKFKISITRLLETL